MNFCLFYALRNGGRIYIYIIYLEKKWWRGTLKYAVPSGSNAAYVLSRSSDGKIDVYLFLEPTKDIHALHLIYTVRLLLQMGEAKL
jgi:hypothetical protein